MADSTMLQSAVIFKRKTLRKGIKFVVGFIVQAHPKGWMDEAGTQQWLHPDLGNDEQMFYAYLGHVPHPYN